MAAPYSYEGGYLWITILEGIFGAKFWWWLMILIIHTLIVKQDSQAYYVAKYMKLYSAVFCCIEYGRAAPSRGLPFYEQFPRVLKPIMT